MGLIMSDHVRYSFKLGKSQEVVFDVATEPHELDQSNVDYPDWARLGFEQCACCPLKEKDCAYCPAAKEINGGMKELKELYDVLEGLNRDFSQRIQKSSCSDAVSNAVVMFFATSVVVASSLDQQLARHQNYLTNTPDPKK